MSTTLTQGASAQPVAPKAAIPPVPLLTNSVANTVSVIHPHLLASLFVWRFEALVADPVSTLWKALPVAVAIQTAFVVLCLPVAGSQNAKLAKKLRPGEKKKDATGPNRFATAVIALLLTGMVTPIFHLLFVLFGAPFVTHVSHTLLCCAHFTVLAVFPILYVRGSDPQALQAVLGASAPMDTPFGGLVGATVGAWLGAVPIPLDWDREWQKWPITIMVGAYAGYIFGTKFVGSVFYGKRWATSGSREE